MSLKDLTGIRYGKLVVQSRAENAEDGRAQWHCKCDCGETCIVKGKYLLNGDTKSCGCLAHAPRYEDLTGNTYGRLTVLGYSHTYKKAAYFKCRCICGEEVTVAACHLKSEHTKSCGCLAREKARENLTTHEWRGTKAYTAWAGAKSRCYNQNDVRYPLYGGRGIRVCERWSKFENFYEDVSKLEHFGEKGYSLDRIDNDGDYCPENVRWAKQKEQCRNRRTNIRIEYEGEEMTLIEASEKSGINYQTLQSRYKCGKRGADLFKPIS